MNFKKYHVSRNLCLVSQSNSITYNTFNNYTISNNTVTSTGQALLGFKCKVEPNTSYTISIKKNTSADLRIREYNSEPTDWATNFVIQSLNTTQTTAVITTTQNTTWILVAFWFSAGGHTVYDIMLNEGSTPLSYEPYSSEVWHDTPYYIHNTSTDTITTLPAVLYPTGSTATVGLKGQTTQSSIPSPTSPVMLQGTGEIETNLAIISGDSRTIENRYYTDVRISDVLETGTYTVSYVIDKKTGNASTSTVGFGSLVAYQKDFKSFTVGNVPITITATVTLESEGCLWARFLRAGSPTDFSYSVSRIRVEKGSHSYGYKIPISSANTTTPVYLGQVETTRKIKKLVLDGTENWKLSSTTNQFYMDTVLEAIPFIPPTCTHFKGVSSLSEDNQIVISASKKINIRTTYIQHNLTDWIAYLQQQYANGTPVTVWYVLAEPETGIINEPLMKIGDYADEVANVSIPVTAGGDTISVDTTVQPSEVTVNYKGWHPVQSVHERESGQWD